LLLPNINIINRLLQTNTFDGNAVASVILVFDKQFPKCGLFVMFQATKKFKK